MLEHLFDWYVSQPTIVNCGSYLSYSSTKTSFPLLKPNQTQKHPPRNLWVIDSYCDNNEHCVSMDNKKHVVIIHSCIAMQFCLSTDWHLPMCPHACVCISIDMCCCVWVYICLPLFVPVSPAACRDRWVISVIGSPPCHLVPVFVDRPCFNLAFVSNLR